MHESDELMIDVRDLRRTFRSMEAVAGISFRVPRGEIFGLLGPNGAGKTTTIRMLTGQLAPTAGAASVAGCDVVREREQLKRRIGVVFEEQNLYERFSARQNLAVSCWIYGLPLARADEVLELVHLEDRAREPVKRFSHGMKQRLMIARALLHRPAVLFLDEPTQGLDPISAREVRTVIEEQRQAGTTILLTTHLLEEADQLCQHVAFLNQGRIVADDTPRRLKLAHGTRTLAVTLGGARAGAAGETGAADLRDITLRMDDPRDQGKLADLLAHGAVRAIHSQEASLEDVFFDVAGVRPA
ncbi:MAG TPA: ABC transporter ATP-binding protein [Dehalococcoidia bacterium]|nr:ABC transporter ATP-binding protein [Dehalococcoidia bacterium]